MTGVPCPVTGARERVLKFRAEVVERVDPTRSVHIDQAIDAIAVEVERIGEQQRFVTKLLAEKAAVGGQRLEPSPSPRVITPH